MIVDPQRTIDALQSHVDSALRYVGDYYDAGFEHHYFRDDVKAQYSTDEIEEIYEDLVLGGIAKHRVESLFHTGRMECSIYGFEQAVMFHFINNDREGALITVDRDVELNLDDFISTCQAEVYES